MLKLVLIVGIALSVSAAKQKIRQAYSPSPDYPAYDSPSPSQGQRNYDSYDQPSYGQPKAPSPQPKVNPTAKYAEKPPKFSGSRPTGYQPPLTIDTYASPVTRTHSVSPPYSDPYSRGSGPTYSTHTSQTLIASLHPAYY